jgi:hypothetical protein
VEDADHAAAGPQEGTDHRRHGPPADAVRGLQFGRARTLEQHRLAAANGQDRGRLAQGAGRRRPAGRDGDTAERQRIILVEEEQAGPLRPERRDRAAQQLDQLGVSGPEARHPTGGLNQQKDLGQAARLPPVGRARFDRPVRVPQPHGLDLDDRTPEGDGRPAVADRLDPECVVPDPDRVALADPLGRPPEAGGVQVRSVRTAEVADHPPFIGEQDLGVPAAHLGVVQFDLLVIEPADPEAGRGGPLSGGRAGGVE